MRVLVLHNTYRQRGGEDEVVRQETTLLRSAGHDVHVELVSNHDVHGFQANAQAFLNAPYDRKRKAWVRELIQRTGAKIVHVHNFFPLLTPAVHEAASDAGVAVVQTLHNYRTLCAGALLLRDGKVCEKCIGGDRYWGVVHRCYRDSLLGSLAVVRMQQRAARRGTWERNVHRFIALTEFSRQKFIEGGLPADQIIVKPNFVPDLGVPKSGEPRSGALFVGRLSPEKGVASLLMAWRALADIPLVIAGDGPERARLEAAAPPGVTFVGQRTSSEVRKLMTEAGCLLVPSIWYEPFGVIVAEAFSVGLPVLASRIGGLSEIVDDDVNGLHFRAGDAEDISEKVRGFFSTTERMNRLRSSARATYSLKYTPERNLALLEDIYINAASAASAN